MSSFLLCYLQLSVSLIVAAAFGVSLSRVGRACPGYLGGKAQLRAQWLLLFGAVVGGAVSLVPKSRFHFETPLKIWTARSYRGENRRSHASAVLTALDQTGAPVGMPPEAPVLTAGFLVVLGLWGWRLRKLGALVDSSFGLRAHGRVQILVSDTLIGPVSFWLPSGAYVVLPASILAHPREMKIVLLHELQHHRSGDTLSAQFWGLIQVLFFWNFLLRTWERDFQELQEIRCDREVIRRRKISVSDYGSCLLNVAARSLEPCRWGVGSLGFAWKISRGHLKRRLENMTMNPKPNMKMNERIMAWGLGILVIGACGAGSLASHAFVQGSRVTLSRAKSLAAEMRAHTEFPVVVDADVVEELNRYVSTPDGRDFFRAARERMKEIEPMLDEKLAGFDAPRELLAIPFVESGYRNLPANLNPLRAAGLWQFIGSSARRFGLRVDERVDERMDLEKSTDAALRYLKSDQYRFNDWLLAILSYNAGEELVQRGIQVTGSRDAFKIVGAGYEGGASLLGEGNGDRFDFRESRTHEVVL